jgi:hypothetical protein
MKSVSGTAKRQLKLGPLAGSLPNVAMAAEHYLAYRFHREPVADGIAAGLLLAFFRNGTSAFGGIMASPQPNLRHGRLSCCVERASIGERRLRMSDAH